MRYALVVAAVLAVPAVLIPQGPARAAASCLVTEATRGQSAEIRADGATLAVPPSRDVKDCSSLAVSSGRVVVVFEAGGDRKSQLCGAGEPRCAVPNGAKSVLGDLMSRLGAALEGAPERRPAGRRYDEDARRLAGLPSGKIYSLERAGLFDFRALGPGGWALAVTREPGRTSIFQRSGSDPVVQLPASLFQRGGKYGWVLTAGGKRFTGGFDVLAAGPAAEVERDLQESGVTGRARTRKQQIDEMLVLFDHDLDHEARLLYRELGL